MRNRLYSQRFDLHMLFLPVTGIDVRTATCNRPRLPNLVKRLSLGFIGEAAEPQEAHCKQSLQLLQQLDLKIHFALVQRKGWENRHGLGAAYKHVWLRMGHTENERSSANTI